MVLWEQASISNGFREQFNGECDAMVDLTLIQHRSKLKQKSKSFILRATAYML